MRWKRASMALAITLVLSAKAQMAAAEEIQIPTSLVAGWLNQAFAGAQLRLNNLGPRGRGTYHLANGSCITLLGSTSCFDIPPLERRGGAGNRRRRQFYVNDVNLQSAQVTYFPPVDLYWFRIDGRFRLRMTFESNGTEIEGKCLIKKIRGGFRCCALGCDSGTPDIQMNNAVLDVSLVPTVFDGTVSYGNVSVGFHANVDSNGIGGWVRDAFVDVKGLLRSGITGKVQSELASPRARHLVAERMRSFLQGLGVREVVSLRSDERYITLEFNR